MSALIRGISHVSSSTRSIDVGVAESCRTEYCAILPTDELSIPYGSADAGHRYNAVTGTNELNKSFVGAYISGKGTITNTEILRSYANAAAITTAVPAYPIDRTDGPYDMKEFVDLFAVAAGEACAGLGPTQMVTMTSGAERSTYTMDGTLVPVPTLSSISVTPGTTDFTATAQTDVDLNPMFWAVVASGLSVTDWLDLFWGRVTTDFGYASSMLDWGYSGVTLGATATNINMTGNASKLVTATNYDLVIMQPNGLTKASLISTTAFTTN